MLSQQEQKKLMTPSVLLQDLLIYGHPLESCKNSLCIIAELKLAAIEIFLSRLRQRFYRKR